jgi:hypothetical protein
LVPTSIIELWREDPSNFAGQVTDRFASQFCPDCKPVDRILRFTDELYGDGLPVLPVWVDRPTPQEDLLMPTLSSDQVLG